MITVNQAIGHYIARANSATPETYPLMWASHYRDFHNLGAFGFPQAPKIGDVAFAAMVAYAICPTVQSSWLMIDSILTGGARELLVARLMSLKDRTGTLTYWRAPLALSDTWTFVGEPVKQAWKVPEVNKALHLLYETRSLNTPRHSFDEAYTTALIMCQELTDPDRNV